MTIICAYRDPATRAIWIGSDARCTGHNGYIVNDTTRKWELCPVVNEHWWVGVAGSNRTLSVLRASAAIWGRAADPHEIVAAMRQALRDDGYLTVSGNDPYGPPSFGQEIILANRRRAWHVSQGFSFSEIGDDLIAAGNGTPHAEAAAWALLDRLGPEVAPHAVVKTAVRAAIRFDNTCGGEVFVQRVE